MQKRILSFLLIVSIANFSCFIPQALAGEGTAGDYFKDIGSKFGRGLANAVTSPAEIPCAMADEMSVRPAAGFFTGFGKGIAFMLRRLLVGVTEVGTFMIPMPPDLPVVCHKASPAVA